MSSAIQVAYCRIKRGLPPTAGQKSILKALKWQERLERLKAMKEIVEQAHGDETLIELAEKLLEVKIKRQLELGI